MYLRLIVLLVAAWLHALGWIIAPVATEPDHDEANGGAPSDVNRRSCTAGFRPVVPAAIRSTAVAVFMIVSYGKCVRRISWELQQAARRRRAANNSISLEAIQMDEATNIPRGFTVHTVRLRKYHAERSTPAFSHDLTHTNTVPVPYATNFVTSVAT